MKELPPFSDTGNRHLVGNGFDVSTGWTSHSFDTLKQHSYLVRGAGDPPAEGIPIAPLYHVYEAKQDRDSPKDRADLALIRQRLYSATTLPGAMLARELEFVRSSVPEHLRDRPELEVAANGLYIVRTRFGDRGEGGARAYSGDQDQGTFATMHGWEHSAFGLRSGQANITKLEALRARQGLPKLFSDDDRVDAANAYGNHDVEMAHGRMADNPDSHDERRSADHAAKQLEQLGVSDRRIETTHAATMATAFNQQTGQQNVDPSRGSVHVQKVTAAADFAPIPTVHGVSTSLELIPEDLSRTYAGYDAPLAKLVRSLNATRPKDADPIRIKTAANAYQLIQKYPDYPVTKTVGGKTIHMTLMEAVAQELEGNAGFFRFVASQTPQEWVMGDPAILEQNAQTFLVLANRVRNGERLIDLYHERVKYEATVSDPLAVGGMPGARG
jgi:hypothetical protein